MLSEVQAVKINFPVLRSGRERFSRQLGGFVNNLVVPVSNDQSRRDAVCYSAEIYPENSIVNLTRVLEFVQDAGEGVEVSAVYAQAEDAICLEILKP